MPLRNAFLNYLRRIYFKRRGLPPAEREAFRKLTVGDLVAPGSQYLGAPFVTGLSAEAQDILSCCNLLIGRKRGSDKSRLGVNS